MDKIITINVGSGLSSDQTGEILRAIRSLAHKSNYIRERINAMSDTTNVNFDELDAELSDLRGSVTGLIGVVTAFRAASATAIDDLNAQIAGLEADAGNAELVTALQAQVTSLETAISDAEANVAEALATTQATDEEVDAAVATFTPMPPEAGSSGSGALLSGATALVDQRERNPVQGR